MPMKNYYKTHFCVNFYKSLKCCDQSEGTTNLEPPLKIESSPEFAKNVVEYL
jgi:hypothetical protein